MTPNEKYNELLASKVIAQLEKRNMKGYYVKTADEAVTLVNSLINKNDTVSFGGSMTLKDTGILDDLRAREDITLLDRDAAKNQDEVEDIFRKSFSADAYLMSTNAISEDGQLVNIDGNGNRVAALIFGPQKVIIVCGLNKVSPSMDAAMLRARTYASPLNTMRLERNTPCVNTGDCHNCFSEESICNQFVITRRSGKPNRIHVILLDGEWGY